MLIKEISKNGKMMKIIHSLEYPEIEFLFSTNVVKNAIKKGHVYKTTFMKNNKLVIGSQVKLSEENYLYSIKNEEIDDNLSELKRF